MAESNDSEADINAPLKEHAHFIHDFNKQIYSIKSIINAYFMLDHYYNSNLFPVTESVSFNGNELVICRSRIYSDYINDLSTACQERIIINKTRGLVAFIDDPFKKEGVIVSADSVMSRSVKFKSYSGAKQLLFFQNAYYYKNIANLSYFYFILDSGLIEGALPHKVDPKNLHNFKYHDFIKNLL